MSSVLNRNARAVLRFLHKVRRHNDGFAFIRKPIDASPEHTSRKRINGTRRLVKEQGTRYQDCASKQQPSKDAFCSRHLNRPLFY